MGSGADGSITIDTELDNTGFKRGSQQMQNAVNGLNNAINRAGKNMASAIQSVNPALRDMVRTAQQSGNEVAQNLGAKGFDKAISDLHKQAGLIANQFSRLSDSETLGVKTDSQMARFSLNVEKARASLSVLIGELNRFANQPINTAEYERLQAEFERLDAAMTKLYQKQNVMQQLGVKENSSQYQRLSLEIENVGKEYDAVREKLNEMRDSGSYMQMGGDTTQYQEMAEKIKELATQLEHYQEVVNSFSGEQSGSPMTNLESNFAQQLAQQMESVAPAANETTSALSSVDNELQQKPKDASIASRAFSMLGHGLMNLSSHIASVAWKGFTSGAKMAEKAVAGVAKGLPKIAWHGFSAGAKAAGKGISALIGRLRGLGKQSHKSTLSNNGLVKSLTSVKRMLLTRIKRTFISALFNSLRTGMQGLARYSSAFNAAMSSMKNSMTGLSGNIAVMAGNLVNAIAPAISTIIDWISRAIAMLNALFALLSGKGTFTVAKKGADEYAKSLGGAGGAAEELKRQVYGFDELNKEDDDSGGGGGGGGADDLFEEQSIEQFLPESISKMFNRIKTAIAGERWEEVGDAVADGLNTAVTTVNNWITNKLEPAAVKWADRIARILNGLISGFDWDNLGQLVGNGINTVSNTVRTFLTRIDFEALGQGFASSIYGLFNTVDWDGLGRTVAAKLNAIIDTLHGFVFNAPWDEMAAKIAEGINGFFKGVNWSKLFLTVGFGIGSIIATLANAITNIDFVGWAESLATGINGLFDGAKWAQLGTDVAKGFNNILDGIKKFFEELNWVEFAESIAEGINGLFDNVHWGTIISTVWLGFKSILLTILVSLSNFHFDTWAKDIADGINNLFADADWDAIVDAIVKATNNIIEGFHTFIDNLNFDQMATTIGNGINNFLSKVNWSHLSYSIFFGVLRLGAALISAISLVNFETVMTGIADGINKAVADIPWGQVARDLGTGLVNAVQGIAVFLEDVDWALLGQSIIDFFSNIPWEALAISLGGLIAQLVRSAISLVLGDDVADSIIPETFIDSIFEQATASINKSSAEHAKDLTIREDMYNEVQEMFSAIDAGVKEGTLSSEEKLRVAAMLIWSGFGNEVYKAEPNLAKAANDVCKTISNAKGIDDVKRAFKTLGFDITDQLAASILAGNTHVNTAIAGLDTGMTESAIMAVGRAEESVRPVFTAFANKIKKSANAEIVSAGAETAKTIKETLSTNVEVLRNAITSAAPEIDSSTALITAMLLSKAQNAGNVINAFKELGYTITRDLAMAIITGEVSVETAVKALAAGMNSEMILTMTDDTINEKVTEYYQEIGEQAGSALGEAAVSSADQGVKAGIDALESKSGELVDSLDIEDQKGTLEKDNKGTAEAGMEAVGKGTKAGTPAAESAAVAAVETIKSPFEGLPDETQAQALLMMQAVELAIESGEPDVTAAITAASQAVVDKAAQIMSNGKGQKIGSNFLQGILKGIQSVRASMLLVVGQIATSVYSAFGDTLSFSAGSNIGAQVCNGIIRGLQNNASDVARAARNVAKKALTSAKDELGIRSPSKAFAEVGGYMMQGMEVGLKNGESDVIKTVSNIANSLTKGLSDDPTISVSFDALNSGLNRVADRLERLAYTFAAIGDVISSMGGLSVPAVAAGYFTPYKGRVGTADDIQGAYGALLGDMQKYQSDMGEDMSDIRSLIRELIEIARNKHLDINGRSLERYLAGLTRDRSQSYGGV